MQYVIIKCELVNFFGGIYWGYKGAIIAENKILLAVTSVVYFFCDVYYPHPRKNLKNGFYLVYAKHSHDRSTYMYIEEHRVNFLINGTIVWKYDASPCIPCSQCIAI